VSHSIQTLEVPGEPFPWREPAVPAQSEDGDPANACRNTSGEAMTSPFNFDPGKETTPPDPNKETGPAQQYTG
jgi:hypothetical protein